MKDTEDSRERYYNYVERQRRGYEITAKMIGYIVKKMQEASIISPNISISGRIKSFKSVYENIGKKAVDDCFGIRIIGSKKDLKEIEQKISQILVVDTIKDHRKKKSTKYNAIHEMAHMNERYAEKNGIDPLLFPEVEIQYWDEEMKTQCTRGELSYANYKKINLKEILDMLDKNPEDLFKDLPTYYEIEGNNIRILSSEETFYKLFPEIKELEEKRRELVIVSADGMQR